MSVGCEYDRMCKCKFGFEGDFEGDFERDSKCECNNGERKRSKERRVCVQGFSAATSVINMCACLSCQEIVSLFDRS